jgi:hypothetical protein
MRATLVRVCAAPEALIATYQAAQTSAEVRTPAPGLPLWLAVSLRSAHLSPSPCAPQATLAGCAAAAALHENYHTQLRMMGRLLLALFTVSSCCAFCKGAAPARVSYRPSLAPPPPPLSLPPQLLSTKQTAFVLLATQPHTLDPEQICQVLLGGGDDDDEGLPGGGDRGHVLAELATSGA